jgi:hypothetical protein
MAFALGLPFIVAFLVGVVTVLNSEGSGLTKAVEAGLMAAAAVGSCLLLKQLVTRRANVEVWPERVLVHYQGRQQPLLILFAEVEHYTYKSLRDREELVFRLRNKVSRKISANRLFGPLGDFDGLVQALESAATQYRQHDDFAMTRARSFFERPIATILLVVATILLALLIGTQLITKQSTEGMLLSAAGVYLTYAASWWNATVRRNQPEL